MRVRGRSWDAVAEIFLQAVEQPAPQRADFLARACAGDDALREEITSLLEACGEADARSFLATRAGVSTVPVSNGSTGVVSGSDECPPRPVLGPGTPLGRYRVLALLNRGGMGEVYRAWDTRLDRTVAIKILNTRFDDTNRLIWEARAASRLEHSHICRLYDVGSAPVEDADIPFLVMELIEGETLAERLVRGPLPDHDALRIALQVAGALEEAHAHGIVHLDLKPGNIQIDLKGNARVLDFGLAALLDPWSDGVPQGVGGRQPLVGTPAYMAPEQLRSGAVDARADIYAFGCVLQDLLTGDTPVLAGMSPTRRAGTRPMRGALESAIGRELARIAGRCLEEAPEQRYGSAAELVRDLRRIVVPDFPSSAAAQARPACIGRNCNRRRSPRGRSGIAW